MMRPSTQNKNARLKLRWEYLTILLLFLLLQYCSREEVDGQSLVKRQGQFYKVNSETPFSGDAILLYSNGQRAFLTPMQDGIVDGVIKSWFENGQISTEGYSYDMKYDGIVSDWDENGQLVEMAHYSKGILSGLYREWYSNGNSKTDCYYSSGKIEGEYTSWIEDGSQDSEGTYLQGEKDGMWSEKSGRETGIYTQGKRIGTWKILGSAVAPIDSLELLTDIEQFRGVVFTTVELIQLFKKKYPQYSETDSKHLLDILFSKYPSYKNWIIPIAERYQELTY
jgi:antitoxin component YwqK of YwqJK toxin-antitoxin module